MDLGDSGGRNKKMAEKVLKTGITRKPGWLYYLDRNLDIYRAKMVRGGEKKQRGQQPELVMKSGLRRDENYLYYVDKAGDISRVKASRGGSAKKGKGKKAAAK